jgi:hypothetical protein
MTPSESAELSAEELEYCRQEDLAGGAGTCEKVLAALSRRLVKFLRGFQRRSLFVPE